MFKNLELDVETFGVANDILYGWDSTFLFELFNGPITEILSYTSPRLIEGRITEEKTYKKIYIYADGTFTVEILIDDVIVATESLTGSKSHEIQVPQDAQVGHYIQFNITGRGEISEIEYEVGRSHGHG